MNVVQPSGTLSGHLKSMERSPNDLTLLNTFDTVSDAGHRVNLDEQPPRKTRRLTRQYCRVRIVRRPPLSKLAVRDPFTIVTFTPNTITDDSCWSDHHDHLRSRRTRTDALFDEHVFYIQQYLVLRQQDISKYILSSNALLFSLLLQQSLKSAQLPRVVDTTAQVAISLRDLRKHETQRLHVAQRLELAGW